MAITKIQAGALPADVITTAAIDDASITHAKLHTTMDLSSKTVTLPTLSTLNTTGNVGIGTDSPSQNLHVSSSDHTRVLVTAGTDKYAELQFENDAQKFAMGVQNDNKFFLYNSTGTSQVLTVDTSSNIGIGTPNPGAKLHVNGASTRVQVSDTGTSFTAQDFLSNSNAVRATIGVERSSGGGLFVGSSAYAAVFGTASNGATQFATNNNIRMTINSSGNVGIGTSSGANLLNIHQADASSNSYLHITHADGGSAATDGLSIGLESDGVNAVIRNRENGYLRMYTNNTERMRIDNDGNVGIGTSNGDVTGDGTASRTYVSIIGSGNRGRLNLGSTAANGADSGVISFVNGTNELGSINMDTNSGVQNAGKLYITSSDDITVRSISDITYQTTYTNSTAGDHIFKSYNTEIMRIDGANNSVTKPMQPVVDVKLTATRTSPGPFATHTVNIDRANNWNSSSHRFTATVAGRYKATLSAYTNYTTSHGYYGLYVNNSGDSMHFNHAGTTAHTMMGYTRIFDLAANDYITAVRSANGGSGMFDLCFMTVELIS
jgi:hypothetical protein